MKAEPIVESLMEKLDNKEVTARMDIKERAKVMVEHGWDKNEAMKIWSFSENNNSNLVTDVTKGVQYLNEIKDHVVAGFQGVSLSGPLCDEPVRGVRFNIHDVKLHADAIHRGGGQIVPTTRRVMYASMLTAQPRLMEPIYLAEIQCPSELVGKIYSIMTRKRGTVIDEDINAETGESTVKAYLPVAESIGFTGDLRGMTGGRAFPQCTFSHWDIINSDPLEPGTKSYDIVREVRKRKGLSEDIPPLSKYLDKL